MERIRSCCKNSYGVSQTLQHPIQEFTVEAYMMDPTQDEDMLVLRAQDTDPNTCVEVRGKKNYEIDGYDPKDKLHSTRQ